MKNIKFLFLVFFVFCTGQSSAQIDSSLLKRLPADTVQDVMNMDALYNRPVFGVDNLPLAIGGYVEFNWQHLGTDGVSEGHQFQFRRLSLFMSATISKKIKFLSEIEFEEGGKEIAIEFASVDIELHPLFNLRGGIILNPIGSFNQNHDGPKWEFVDRPISSTQMLPATWSNAGFGVFGKYYSKEWMLGYECYISGGFDNTIIDNELNKTFLPASKANKERFEESASGTPLVTAKMAVRHDKAGELGVSWMGGIYNNFEDDGIELDKKRRCDVFALDYNHKINKTGTQFIAEWAWVWVDVPAGYSQQYAQTQHGGFMDVVQPIIKRPILGWESAVINLACRLEYVDWNTGEFSETGDDIGDQLWSVVPAVSFRPTPLTVIRLNYRILQQTDLHNNPPSKTGGFSFGLSTYF